MSRRRHVVAATLGVGALVLGSVALAGTATADQLLGRPVAKVAGTTSFTCTAGSFPSFDYDATITVSAYRDSDGASDVTLVAEVSDMPGVVPVTLGSTAITDELVLDLGGTPTTLVGNGSTRIAAREPLEVPDLTGTASTTASSVSATVTTFDYALPAFSMGGTCTPTAGAALGTLTIETGPVPTGTPSPTATASPTESPTATASPTGTPTESPTATESSSGEGVPAKGAVDFACVLNPLGSEFDYPATVTVNGYREEEGGPVILSAKMTDIPGISPVAIDGDMTVTLDLTVGGTAVTLEGASQVSEAARAKVPVPRLTGEVAADEDEMEVAVSAFSFEIVTTGLTVDAPCQAPDTSLGRMVVGTEPPEDEETEAPTTDPAATSAAPTSGSSSGSLPKTGGSDALPVVVLWAGALTLLGTAGLIAVPQLSRRRTH